MSCADTISFLEMPVGCSNGVMTRSQEKKKQKKITIEKFNKHFQNNENIQRWLTADDSEIEILNKDDRLYIAE